MTSLLIGATGYVGSFLSSEIDFDVKVHRSDIHSISGQSFDSLICAGLPASKWLANSDPNKDFDNVKVLAKVLSTVSTKSATLISTIDVYQPPRSVCELDPANLKGAEAYGVNRAWFEAQFLENFPFGKIIRLPGLYSRTLRKNLVFDLLNKRVDQLRSYSAFSEFQFMDLGELPRILSITDEQNISLLNVTSEPVTAHQIAEVFGVLLEKTESFARYDVKTIHGSLFGTDSQYLFSNEEVIEGIRHLKEGY